MNRSNSININKKQNKNKKVFPEKVVLTNKLAEKQ
jgi:hypothetical protein